MPRRRVDEAHVSVKECVRGVMEVFSDRDSTAYQNAFKGYSATCWSARMLLFVKATSSMWARQVATSSTTPSKIYNDLPERKYL